MDNFDGSRQVADPEVLRQAVMKRSHGLKADAPQERLTANTFAANAGVLDWAQRGDLVRAVRAYNEGGTFNPHSNVFVPKDFYLMRIYDAAEALGRKQFEQFVPGIWDSMLAAYRMTFATKIQRERSPAQVDEAPVDTDNLYGDRS